MWPWLLLGGGLLVVLRNLGGASTPAVDAIPLSKLPEGDRRNNARIIEQQAYAAGFDVRVAMAMIANAQRESGLNAKADTGDGGKAVGLFQVHPWGGSKEQRKDPVYNTQIMLKVEALPPGIGNHGNKFRAIVADPQSTAGDIAYAWCAELERPADIVGQGNASRDIVSYYWPGVM